MTRLLRDAGEALFGPRWQTEVAKALQVSDRTIRRWAADDEDLPSGVALDLWRLCEERTLAIEAVRDRLKAAASP